MSERSLGEPWRSFLNDLDTQLSRPTELRCLGGFVIRELYDFERVTADLDVLDVTGPEAATLAGLAGRTSALHRQHKVYLDIVTVAHVPDRYEERLTDLHARRFRHLHLKALERHDLVLAKLARNLDRDREDVRRLAARPGLDPELLKARYESELRYQLGRPEREDLTLQLWLDMIREVRA